MSVPLRRPARGPSTAKRRRRPERASAAACVLAACAAVVPEAARPDAVVDASWGRTPQTLTGSFTIPESLGRRAGTNLFHSFERFGVGRGESATFTTSSADLRNVITRVTGAEPSLIDGRLRLSPAPGSAPDFYFINPNGITWGADARVDVPAALHLSTAGTLRFADGSMLQAGRGPDGTLSVAAPEAFGFLGGPQVSGLRFAPGARLNAFSDGRDIDLTAGRIELDQASAYTANGRLRVVAVGDAAASVPADPRAAPATGDLAGALSLRRSFLATDEGSIALHAGTITLAESSSVEATPLFPAAGSIEIFARDAVRIGDSLVGSLMIPSAAQGPTIEVRSLGTLEIDGASGGIQTTSLSDAAAGDIKVVAASASLNGGAGIGTLANGSGPAGSITVDVAGPLRVSGMSGILSQAVGSFDPTGTASGGAAGSIAVTAGALTLDGGGGLGQATITTSANFVPTPAGRVTVVVNGPLVLRGGATISSSASANPLAAPSPLQAAGSIVVEARSITIESLDSDLFTSGIFSDSLGFAGSLAPGPGGPAGSISVSAPEIALRGAAAVISTDTSGPGAAGSVSIRGGRLLIDGMGSGSARTAISSSTSGEGRGGTVEIRLSEGLVLSRGGRIEATTLSSGPGGAVVVDAPNVLIDGGGVEPVTGIVGVSLGAGRAGDLSITAANQVSIVRGGVVAASANGSGAAGAITIRTRDLLVDAQGDAFTGIRSRALPDSGGLVGRIAIVADGTVTLRGAPEAVTIRNESTAPGLQGLAPRSIELAAGQLSMCGARLVASSSGSAPGSAIRVTATGGVSLVDDARVLTSAQDGNGGPIELVAGRYVRLRDALVESSVLGAVNGNGGDIRVSAPVMVLDNGSIQANTTAPRASGGDIAVDVRALIPSLDALRVGGAAVVPFDPRTAGFNVIQAAAPEGVSGNIRIASPALDLAGALAALEAGPVDLGALGRDVCGIGAGSSMAWVGRGGLPPSVFGTLRPKR